MKNIKFIIGAIIAIAIVGAYFFPKSTHTTVLQAGAAGDTNSTQRIAQTVLDLSTTTPTTVSGACTLMNGDSRDRIIISIDYYLTSLTSFTSNGSGVASTTWVMSTSTGIYLAPAGSYVLNTTLATSTANGAVSNQLYVGTTTPGATATFPYRVWTAGSCLNLVQNSTSTAAGTIRVGYIVSQ